MWGSRRGGAPGRGARVCEGPGRGRTRGLGSLRRGRGASAVPGGASAVVEHEGPVGVARAAHPRPRPPGRVPRAAHPVGKRHARRQRRLGSGTEGKSFSAFPETQHFSPSPRLRKPVPGSGSGRQAGRAPCRLRREWRRRRARREPSGGWLGSVRSSPPGNPPPPRRSEPS